MAGAHHSVADREPRAARAGRALADVSAYAASPAVESPSAGDGAYGCLLDGLACGFAALGNPACAKILGPVVAGATMAHGARVPGTSYELDPVTAAFNIGALVRWADCNDAAFAADWGHQADNIGAVLAVGDYLARKAQDAGGRPPIMRELLAALAQAHEIQRIAALALDCDRAHGWTVLVRVASTAVAARLLGGGVVQIAEAVADAARDGGPLHRSRSAEPLAGWAAGDANSRGVRLALLALAGRGTEPAAAAAAGVSRAVERRGPPGGDARRSFERFAASVDVHFGARQAALIRRRCADPGVLADCAVHEFVALLVKNG